MQHIFSLWECTGREMGICISKTTGPMLNKFTAQHVYEKNIMI